MNFLQSEPRFEVASDKVTLRKDIGSALDPGEASVIQVALDKKISIVAIDELVGRRIARLNGLTTTGSLGMMIRAIHEGHAIDLQAQEALRLIEK